jgi:hypothetical protein
MGPPRQRLLRVVKKTPPVQRSQSSMKFACGGRYESAAPGLKGLSLPRILEGAHAARKNQIGLKFRRDCTGSAVGVGSEGKAI